MPVLSGPGNGIPIACDENRDRALFVFLVSIPKVPYQVPWPTFKFQTFKGGGGGQICPMGDRLD